MHIKDNGIKIPDYINRNFFQSLTTAIVKRNDYIIKSVNFGMGSGGGDNYCSYIYRVVIEVLVGAKDVKRFNLIIKSLPITGERQVFGEMQLYQKEVDMYRKMVPRLEQLLNKKLAAKCYYAQKDPIQTIVFEDLKELGYRMANRQVGLDEEHCALILKKLGNFHAASYYLAEKEPSLINDYNSGLFGKKTLHFPLMKTVFLDNFKIMIKAVATWPGYAKIVNKLKKIENHFLQRFGETAETSVNEIKVLNHGDLWVNNFMFKYTTEFSRIPNDVAFLDFQGSYFASPGIDLNYFLYTSVQVDVLENQRCRILKEYYYDSFRRTLENLGCKNLPTFDDILAEIRRKEFYGFCAAVGVLALICMDKEASQDNSVESLSNKDIAEKKGLIACSTKRYQEMMRYILNWQDLIGLYD